MKINDIDTKIELNIKQIEFYHTLYQKNQNKISFLIVIFSFIGLYIVEILKYLFSADCNFFFMFFASVFLILLLISLYITFCLIKPIDVTYVNQPKYFYNEILEEYKAKLETDDEELLDEYVRITYLGEIETVLENNIKIYRKKTQDFANAFKFLIPTLVLYLAITSFVIVEKKEEDSKFAIKNYKEIINYMEEKDKNKPAEKPKIDPKMVIKTKPIVIRESIMFSKQEKIVDKKKKKE